MSGHEAAGRRIVRVLVEYWRLRIIAGGPLMAWLGPALRGVLAGWFKDRVCRHDAQQRKVRWTTCDGCPHLLDCPYGATFEYDRPESRQVTADLRPVALQVGYPAPAEAEPGDNLLLRLVLIGELAVRCAVPLREALREVGRHRVLGSGGVQFCLEPTEAAAAWEAGLHTLDPLALPRRVETAAGACVPRLALHLLTPLFLKGGHTATPPA